LVLEYVIVLVHVCIVNNLEIIKTNRGDYMCLVLLKAAGLIVGFLGSILLLKEPVRLRLKDGRVEVDTDIKVTIIDFV